MVDLLAFLSLLSIFGGVVGFFITVQYSGLGALLTLFSGFCSAILWYALSQILNYLKSMNENINTNNELIQKLSKQLRDYTKVLNTEENEKQKKELEEKYRTEENWKCTHCGSINPHLESRCKKCGFY